MVEFVRNFDVLLIQGQKKKKKMKVKEIVKTSYYATLAELARNHQKLVSVGIGLV